MHPRIEQKRFADPRRARAGRQWWVFAALTAAVAVTLALVFSTGRSSVDRSANDRARRASVVMSREKGGTAVDMVRRVVGGDAGPVTSLDSNGADLDAIEALVAEGDRFGGRIVLRITEREAGGPWNDNKSTVRCYEYQLDGGGISSPDWIDCPALDAITIPPPAPEPTIPDGTAEKLELALGRLVGTEPTEAAVTEAARSVVGEAPTFRVATVDDAIGVAVGNGDDECVFARVTPAGVEVWRVPPVIAQPGELGCYAESAATGDGKHYPH